LNLVWSTLGDGLAHPVKLATVRGDGAGPQLAVLGGVHGDEPEGVLAARRLLALLETMSFRGTVVVVPVACPGACAANTRTSAVDGLNLARTFPGDPAGTDTARLADALTHEVIEPADLLVDLHSAGKDYEMPLFAGAFSGGGETGRRSSEAAIAFGAPTVWLHDALNPGRSISAAADLGIPSVYVESGSGGSLQPAVLDAYLDGMLRIMRFLGMVDDAPRTGETAWLVDGANGDIDEGLAAPFDGWLVQHAVVGDQVDQGAPLAELVSRDASRSELVTAERSGTVLMLRRTARIDAGALVALVGPRLRPLCGDAA
jgi:predicted deacylase